ncbi:MAG: hypothetical protein ACI9GB_003109 [Halioglobus sp.]|jgi:hypothetical protein
MPAPLPARKTDISQLNNGIDEGHTMSPLYPLTGGCDCENIRYRLESKPLIVHCCHCRWCQRETGASFALNAVIEANRVTTLAGEPEIFNTPSDSGDGQLIARCPQCRIALWSNYSGFGPAFHFIRVGSLDEPDHLPPDIHIFTETKQPWVMLSPDTHAVPVFYSLDEIWSSDSLERLAAMPKDEN